jgi:hypothetical protein
MGYPRSHLVDPDGGSITFAQDLYAVHFSVVTTAQLGLILIIVGNGWKIAFWRWRNCLQ